jgi:ABC-type nitrate/sulfonate/bicarbonate transport system substrate-binding protein
MDTLRIAQPSDVLLYLPLYLALEGTGHEVLSYGSPKAALEAVAQGEADLAVGDPFLFNYIDYTANDLAIIAGFARKLAHTVITFNPFITEAAPAQLRGRTIVCYPEPSTSFFIARNLKEEYDLAGLLPTPFNTELGPLLTQEADLAVVIEPNTTYALRNRARALIDLMDTPAVLTGFCAARSFAAKRKQALAAFLETVRKGIEIFNADPGRALGLARRRFPLVDEQTLGEALGRIRKADIYCRDLRFSDDDVAAGRRVRQIAMPIERMRRFLTYLA